MKHRIRIETQPRFLSEYHDEAPARFAFAYTITIYNEGREDAQLLTRHWIITDGDENIEEVQGDGVIGQQPWIAPGEHFEYTSGAVIATPIGTMQGEYIFQNRQGERFEVAIPCFLLAKPGLVH